MDAVGYVQQVYVEQEDGHDQIKFQLKIFTQWGSGTSEHDQWFKIYLDKGTTVAFAQLQLLRDALDSLGSKQYHLVRVHFTFQDATLDWGYVYYVRLVASQPYPTTMQDYYDGAVVTWFTHVD